MFLTLQFHKLYRLLPTTKIEGKIILDSSNLNIILDFKTLNLSTKDLRYKNGLFLLQHLSYKNIQTEQR